MSRAWAGGSTRAWRRQRARVLRRDGYLCQLRIPGVCTTTATHVHHVKGKGVSELDRDMCAACPACNYHVGQPGRERPDHKTISSW